MKFKLADGTIVKVTIDRCYQGDYWVCEELTDFILTFAQRNATLEAWHQHPNGGGWVENTASVEPTAFVGEDAQVYGNAWVYDNAQVCDNARVYGGELP